MPDEPVEFVAAITYGRHETAFAAGEILHAFNFLRSPVRTIRVFCESLELKAVCPVNRVADEVSYFLVEIGIPGNDPAEAFGLDLSDKIISLFEQFIALEYDAFGRHLKEFGGKQLVIGRMNIYRQCLSGG